MHFSQKPRSRSGSGTPSRPRRITQSAMRSISTEFIVGSLLPPSSRQMAKTQALVIVCVRRCRRKGVPNERLARLPDDRDGRSRRLGRGRLEPLVRRRPPARCAGLSRRAAGPALRLDRARSRKASAARAGASRTKLYTTVYELASPAAVETKEFAAMRGWARFAPHVRSQTRVVVDAALGRGNPRRGQRINLSCRLPKS